MSGLTRQQITTQIRALIDQPDVANSRFTDANLQEYIDEAVNYTATQIEYPRDFIEIQAELGVGAYTLLTDALILRTAYFGDKSISRDIIPLTIVSEETLKSMFPSWLDENAGANGKPQYLILLDRRTAFIYPKPDSTNSASGKKLIIDYIYNPAALASDSDIPDLPIPYHGILQFYAAHLAYLRLNNADMSAKILAMYQGKIKELKSSVIKETTEGMRFDWASDLGLDNDTSFGVNP